MPDALRPDIFPVGAIAYFSGTLATIPKQWQLCDGTNGTPDLHDTFLRGAPAGIDGGSTGGENTHILTTSEMPAHNHSFSNTGHTHTYGAFNLVNSGDSANPFEATGAAVNTSSNSSGVSVNNAGSGNAHENKPAFVELAHIERIY